MKVRGEWKYTRERNGEENDKKGKNARRGKQIRPDKKSWKL